MTETATELAAELRDAGLEPEFSYIEEAVPEGVLSAQFRAVELGFPSTDDEGNRIYDVGRWASASASARVLYSVAELEMAADADAVIKAEKGLDFASAYATAMQEYFGADLEDESSLEWVAENLGSTKAPTDLAADAEAASTAMNGGKPTARLLKQKARKNARSQAFLALDKAAVVTKARLQLTAAIRNNVLENPMAERAALVKGLNWAESFRRAMANRPLDRMWLVEIQRPKVAGCSSLDAAIKGLKKIWSRNLVDIQDKMTTAVEKKDSEAIKDARAEKLLLEAKQPTAVEAITQLAQTEEALLIKIEESILSHIGEVKVRADTDKKVKHDKEVETGDSLI